MKSIATKAGAHGRCGSVRGLITRGLDVRVRRLKNTQAWLRIALSTLTFVESSRDGNGMEEDFLTDTRLVARHGLIEGVPGLSAPRPLLVLRAVQLWIVET